MICPNCGANVHDGSLFCTNCGVRFLPPSPQAAPVYQAAPAPQATPIYQAAPAPQAAPVYQAAPAPQASAPAPIPEAPVEESIQPTPEIRTYNYKSFVEIFWEKVSCKLAAYIGFLASAFMSVIACVMSVVLYGNSSYAILALFAAIFGIAGSYLTLERAKAGGIVLCHSVLFMFLSVVTCFGDAASIFALIIMSGAASLAMVASFVPNFPLAQREEKCEDECEECEV